MWNSEEIFTLVSTGEVVSLFSGHMARYWAVRDLGPASTELSYWATPYRRSPASPRPGTM